MGVINKSYVAAKIRAKKNATPLKYFKTFDELRVSVLNAFRKYLEVPRGSFG
jgi:hypothetical protein